MPNCSAPSAALSCAGLRLTGSFFTRVGTELAVKGALERMGVTPLPQVAAQAARPALDSTGLAAESAVLLRN
jgi:hypothetical protein